MKIKHVLETNLEEIAEWDFLFYTPKDDPETKLSVRENIPEAAKTWGISSQCVEDLMEAFDFMRDQFVEHVKADLEDIWEKVEKV